jgi:hypothetical protein
MKPERRVLKSLAEAIVTLGDEAGCILQVGPEALVAVFAPDSLVSLSAEEAIGDPEASQTFIRRLHSLGITHPSLGVALELYARLAKRISHRGACGFAGAGKTVDQLSAIFATRNPEPSKPPAP